FTNAKDFLAWQDTKHYKKVSKIRTIDMSYRFNSAMYGGKYMAYIEVLQPTISQIELMKYLIEGLYKIKKWQGDLDELLDNFILISEAHDSRKARTNIEAISQWRAGKFSQKKIKEAIQDIEMKSKNHKSKII